VADDILIAPLGDPYPVVTDELPGGRHVQVLKNAFGPDGALSFVEPSNPLPVLSLQNLPAASRLSSVPINFAAAGDNQLVAGVAAQTVRLFRFWFFITGQASVKFRDGLTDFHPAIPFTDGSWVMDFDGEPWFVTSPGNPLNLNVSSAAQISGRCYFIRG